MMMEAIMAVKEPDVPMIKKVKDLKDILMLENSFVDYILDMEDYSSYDIFYYLITASEFQLNELSFSNTYENKIMDIMILDYEQVQTLWKKINNLDESLIVGLCRIWVVEYESTSIYQDIPKKFQRLKEVCEKAYLSHGYLLVWGKQ